jgi:hypothetical protein
MALRAGHGDMAGTPRIEVLPADELPVGIPAQAPAPAERRPDGTFAPGCRGVQSLGGKAKHSKLARSVGLTDKFEADFAEYRQYARQFRTQHVRHLARTVGAGVCGPAPSSIVATAALQLAMSRYLTDRAGGDMAKMAMGSRLANESRQNLLAAHELCAREAQARPKQSSSVLESITAAGRMEKLPPKPSGGF